MKKHQKALDHWFKQKKWQYWPPLEILARLMEEVGELARLVNHLHGSKKKKDSEGKQELEMEIGDILYTLICLANSQGIDLDGAIEKSFKKVAKRDRGRFAS